MEISSLDRPDFEKNYQLAEMLENLKGRLNGHD